MTISEPLIDHTSTCSSDAISSAANRVSAIEITPSDTSILVTEDSSTIISEDTSVMSITEANTLISASLRQPGKNDYYMIEDLNVTQCVYDFQMFAISLLGATLLHFESNLQHTLSLSSILLLEKKKKKSCSS